MEHRANGSMAAAVLMMFRYLFEIYKEVEKSLAFPAKKRWDSRENDMSQSYRETTIWEIRVCGGFHLT